MEFWLSFFYYFFAFPFSWNLISVNRSSLCCHAHCCMKSSVGVKTAALVFFQCDGGCCRFLKRGRVWWKLSMWFNHVTLKLQAQGWGRRRLFSKEGTHVMKLAMLVKLSPTTSSPRILDRIHVFHTLPFCSFTNNITVWVIILIKLW